MRISYGVRRSLRALALASLLGGTAPAWAITESFNIGDDQLKMVLNNTFTAGGAIRMQAPSVNLIGKGDLNRNVCGVPYQACQGVFKDQIFPAQHLAASPGAATINTDDGDLNYSKYHFFQAVAKETSDITLSYKDFGIFARALYFYDFVNNDFTQTQPNEVTAKNRNDADVGINSQLLATGGSVATPVLIPYPGGKVFGPGKRVREKRTDGEVLRQIGTGLQYLDSYFYGKLPIPFTEDKKLSFKIGRQTVNWGESTTIVINSLNQANPVNANNFNRVGNQVEEDFVPINMIDLSFEPLENTTLETFYQLEWKPVEIAAPGSYFSDVDFGTNNTGKTLNTSFGQNAYDPDGVAALQYNPLALLTNTTTTAQRLPDREARTRGQFGVKLDYYADWLNNGTDLSAYFMHYNSRLPYASFYSADGSCARKGGKHGTGALGPGSDIDATDSLSFLAACPDLPVLHELSGDPQKATSSILALNSVKLLLEYPNDINLIGASFNTTVGSWSIQGEVAYRPNEPLQVDQQDLFFAALGPTLTSCSNPNVHCAGTPLGGLGYDANNNLHLYGSSDYAAGKADTIEVLAGAIPGVARSFPNFIIPYRGGVIGENPPHSYIRGFERFQVFQFNLGTTRVLGATDNPFGADQVLFVSELGATYVPFLPPLDRLQLEGPGTNYAASAGADGSGADGSRMACSNAPDCALGADGLRFNPHQQDATGYPKSFSWGYRLIGIFKYENVLPGIGLQPTIFYSQDVQGTAPGPGGNFVAGRKQVNTLVETRYKQALSFDVGYTWYWGGGMFNTLSDRDFAQFFVKYQF